ncbi:MAG: hypothetical protein N2235_16810 [Fischerella sp.]|nr:hypothetical protein [Fischerella sp.]
MFRYVLIIILSVFFITFHPTVFAHQVKTTAEVGAILHIEPNDTPRSGEPTTVWFALTRKGGKVIPLAECNCQLAVYAEPYASGEPPLLEPTLEPVSAERYQGIPGSKITFPRPGSYQLHLRGEPSARANFKPFNLKFNVTVAAGKSVPEDTKNLSDINQNIPNRQTRTTLPWTIAGFGLIAIGFLFFLVQRVNRN